jgi:hypothetical protein
VLRRALPAFFDKDGDDAGRNAPYQLGVTGLGGYAG